MVRLSRVGLVMLALLTACEARSVAGVWCQFRSDCRAPNECSFHRCRPACTTGADCATGICLVGHCGVVEDEGCATMFGRECASPLVCTDDRCSLPAPAPDAGMLDGGSADAATIDAPDGR